MSHLPHSQKITFTLHSPATKDSTDLGLELHDLELLRELVKLLIDVHHSYRGVQHLPSPGVHFLFTKTQPKKSENSQTKKHFKKGFSFPVCS